MIQDERLGSCSLLGKKKLRILHLVADPATGVLLVSSIARMQAADGFSVEFATGPGESLDQLRQIGFPVSVVPITRRFVTIKHLVALYALWRLMRRERYDVLHAHTPIASFLGRLAARYAGIPVVIQHMRGSWWDSSSRLTRLIFSAVERIAGQWTTHTFTINCSDAADLVRIGAMQPGQVTCLHCGAGGVDVDKFSPKNRLSPETVHARTSFGFSSADIVIVFIGRLVREKGLFDLIEAYSGLVQSYPRIKLLIVGGTLKSERDQVTGGELQRIVASRPYLHRNVVFTGFRRDIPEMIALGDIVVLPSYREGFGMVLAEASATGIPVISSSTRGGCEALAGGATGLLVPIGDVSSLKAAIERLVTDEKLRAEFGGQGRRLALERFNRTKIESLIREKYDQLLRQ